MMIDIGLKFYSAVSFPMDMTYIVQGHILKTFLCPYLMFWLKILKSHISFIP